MSSTACNPTNAPTRWSTSGWNSAGEPSRRPVPIRFIGVWDTVGALGAPTPILGRLTRNKVSFHNTQLGENVEHAYHALAVDERRRPFQPDLWTGAPAEGQTIEQVLVRWRAFQYRRRLPRLRDCRISPWNGWPAAPQATALHFSRLYLRDAVRSGGPLQAGRLVFVELPGVARTSRASLPARNRTKAVRRHSRRTEKTCPAKARTRAPWRPSGNVSPAIPATHPTNQRTSREP